MTLSRIIVALDFDGEKAALELVDRLQPKLCRLKVGKELFTALGPAIVEKLVARGFDVFLDLKYHDIPNTVAKACVAAAELGVWMINVHALGGRRMLTAAREAIDRCKTPPLLIAVTVLTSMTTEDLQSIGVSDQSPAQWAGHLASLAQASGFDGIVCSAQEAMQMRRQFGASFMLVTPGIRLIEDGADDQRRVMTPVDAVRAGADYLVMGRSITNAEDPVSKLLTINSDISGLLKQ